MDERRHRTVRRICVTRKPQCHTKSGASGSSERLNDHQGEGPTADAHIGFEPADPVAHSQGKPQKHSVSAAGFGHLLQRSALRQLQSLQVQGSRAEINRAWQILPMKQREHTLNSSKSESEPLLSENYGPLRGTSQRQSILSPCRAKWLRSS